MLCLKRSKMIINNCRDSDMIRRSLVLAGGGMRLAYQAGVLIALEEEGLEFNHVDGTSGGIFGTAMLASNLSPTSIANRWRTLKMSGFVSMRRFWNYFSPLKMDGYIDADNIRDKVLPDLGIDISTINNNTVNATFNVCNFSDKTIEAIGNRNVTIDHLLAGVSLPIVMPALKIEGKWYSDAVWIKDANILEAVKQGASEIYLVWAIGNNWNYLPGALNQYVHMIEMSANGALLEDFNQIRLMSAINERKVKLFVIKPEFPLPLDPDLFFDKIDARTLINMGYSDAKDCIKAMPSEGVIMDKDATRMSEPGTRLCFRSTHHGNIVWRGTLTKITVYTYFRYSELSSNSKLSIFSSIKIDSIDKEIPLFDIHVKIEEKAEVKSLSSESKFILDENIYLIKFSWKLAAPLDILIGLGFKKMTLNIFKDDKQQEELAHGVLYQSIKDRLKGCLSTNVRTDKGSGGNIIMKYKLISKFITHEV